MPQLAGRPPRLAPRTAAIDAKIGAIPVPHTGCRGERISGFGGPGNEHGDGCRSNKSKEPHKRPPSLASLPVSRRCSILPFWRDPDVVAQSQWRLLRVPVAFYGAPRDGASRTALTARSASARCGGFWRAPRRCRPPRAAGTRRSQRRRGGSAGCPCRRGNARRRWRGQPKGPSST